MRLGSALLAAMINLVLSFGPTPVSKIPKVTSSSNKLEGWKLKLRIRKGTYLFYYP